MLNDKKIIEIANKANADILNELTDKTIKIILEPIATICKDTYLAKSFMNVIGTITMMLVNPKLSWYSFRWAVGKLDSKAKEEAATYDNGRRIGLYQGMCLALNSLWKQNDQYIASDIVDDKDTTKPLCRIFKLIDKELEEKVYLAFKELYDKEMAKYNLKPKDLYKVLAKQYKLSPKKS